jgi:hypothetical protein
MTYLAAIQGETGPHLSDAAIVAAGGEEMR